MQLDRIEGAVDSFLNARRDGVYFPPEWYGRLSLDDGCRVQLGVLKRLVAGGAQHVGWKVGLTSEAIQRQFEVPEPVFGFLLAESTGGQCERNRECDESHCDDFARSITTASRAILDLATCRGTPSEIRNIAMAQR